MTTTDRWILSMHAWERAEEMGYTREDIVAALDAAEYSYNSFEDECRIYVKGRIAVVANPEVRMVVTVLWHGQEYARPKLTLPQRTVLLALVAAHRSGLTNEQVEVPRAVLRRLEHRKLVRYTKTKRWRITPAGRKAIAG